MLLLVSYFKGGISKIKILYTSPIINNKTKLEKNVILISKATSTVKAVGMALKDF